MRGSMLFAFGLLTLALTVAGAAGTAEAQRRTPTPSVTPTGTATPGSAPAPPDFWNTRDTATTLVWNDRSDNEDGFDIEAVACAYDPANEAHFLYRVPANTTSFEFPQEYIVARSRCPCGSQKWTVTAFNAFGRASTTLGTGIDACVLSPTATPAVFVMPGTGTGGGGGGGPSEWAAALIAGMSALFGAGVVVRQRARRRGSA